MNNQDHLNTMKQKEIEKEKERIMNQLGFPISMILLRDNGGAPWEITTTTTSAAGSTLIPRITTTNITVYAMTADARMDLSRRPRINYVQHGTNINNNNDVARLTRGTSIVRNAISTQKQDMLQSVLKHEPELINYTDEEGLTPLSYAALNGYVDMVSFILKKYPKSINYRNKDKSYPIHKACLGGHVNVLEKFHERSPASIGAVDKQGQTILHLAAKQRGNQLKQVVIYLLRLHQGRELLNKNDENGYTPLDLAKTSRNLEVQQIIESL